MLEPIKDKWNIVILGKWNTSILSPKWLADNIWEDTEFEVEYPLEPGLPQRITADSVRIVPFPGKLILSPSELVDDNLQKMEKIAVKLLDNLPHTPISHTGINFAYRLSDAPKDLLDHFPMKDASSFADYDMNLIQASVSRSLEFEGRTLNLSAEVKDDAVVFSFNFHAKTPSAGEAREKLEDSVLKLKSFAEKILYEVYGLRRES